jgi:8-oxo-dGTP pyrophosphatase MutT (NUDIX family)
MRAPNSDEARNPQAKTLRPRLAASLILTRPANAELEVLMGRRSAKHVFMPNKYVFPGGRVDRADSTGPFSSDLDAGAMAVMCRSLPERRARAAAIAAVRETVEETGLLIASTSPCKSRHANWKPFRDENLAPDLSQLKLITRAVTPPGRSRRFDTWFFTADSAALFDDRAPTPSPELEDVHWVPLSQAHKLDLPMVTHFVLGELERVSEPAPKPPRWIHGDHGNMVVKDL